MNLTKTKSILHRIYASFGEMLRIKSYALTWGVVLLLSVMGMADLPASNLMGGPMAARWAVIALICVFKSSAITYILYLSRRRKAIFTCMAAATGIYALLCLVNVISYGLYGFGITTKMMTLIAQTNAREAGEFRQVMGKDVITALSHPGFWAGLALCVAFLYILPWLGRRKGAVAAVIATSAAGLAGLCYCAVDFYAGKTSLSVGLRTAANIKRCIDDRRMMEELEICRKPFPYPDRIVAEGRAASVILVIGESASRDHHSVYGYPLPTTPYLDSLRRELFIFSDALASSTTTSQNIECILSFKSDNDTTKSWHDTPWLIDLYDHAGYRTYWISNQEKTGAWSNASAVMVSKADVINYIGAENNSDHTLDKDDSHLLPYFDKAIAEGASRKLICLHLLGSHFVYSKRYPPEYAAISSADVRALPANAWMDSEQGQTVADYDNSIRYTDTILRHLIESASGRNEPTVLVYMSDHGEYVYDGRDFRGRARTSVRVPFIVYANKSYRERNPEIISRLKEAEGMKFSTSDAIHILMDLTGISYPYYDPAKDVLSGKYVPRTRYVDDTAWEYDKR